LKVALEKGPSNELLEPFPTRVLTFQKQGGCAQLSTNCTIKINKNLFIR